jgi:4-hydroxy-tetrahydrodipicolinate synthase
MKKNFTMNKPMLSGIIAYTITPFSEDGEHLNIKALNSLIDALIDSGANAIAALGSAGEGVYLDDDEWKRVALSTVKHVNGRIPVIIGIAALTTKKAVDRAMYAFEIGAQAIMVSPFSYYRLTEDEIYDHYAAISAATSLSIMIYNNPATCGVDMSPEFMLSMVENIDNATMIKESTGNLQRMRTLHRLSKGSVPFFNGCNYIALDALNAGAVGWCTAAPCLLNDLPKQLFDCVQQGQVNKAEALFERQLPLLEFIVNGGLASTVKAGLDIKGLAVGVVRRPLKQLTTEKKKTLEHILLQVIG